jgi:hypothetical protein
MNPRSAVKREKILGTMAAGSMSLVAAQEKFSQRSPDLHAPEGSVIGSLHTAVVGVWVMPEFR